MEHIEAAIRNIVERNERVTMEKAWETSWTRRLCIAALTYVVVALFLTTLNLPLPFLSALVPTFGFLISTLSLSFIKKIWAGGRKK